jgi:hypothetical protein
VSKERRGERELDFLLPKITQMGMKILEMSMLSLPSSSCANTASKAANKPMKGDEIVR